MKTHHRQLALWQWGRKGAAYFFVELPMDAINSIRMDVDMWMGAFVTAAVVRAMATAPCAGGCSVRRASAGCMCAWRGEGGAGCACGPPCGAWLHSLRVCETVAHPVGKLPPHIDWSDVCQGLNLL